MARPEAHFAVVPSADPEMWPEWVNDRIRKGLLQQDGNTLSVVVDPNNIQAVPEGHYLVSDLDGNVWFCDADDWEAKFTSEIVWFRKAAES